MQTFTIIMFILIDLCFEASGIQQKNKFEAFVKSDILILKAQNHYRLGNMDSSLYYYRICIKTIGVQDSIGLSDALNNSGLCYFQLGRQDSALQYFQRSLLITRKMLDTIRWAGRLRNIGIAHKSKGEFVRAIQNYEAAAELLELINNHETRVIRNLGAIQTSLGNLYMDLQEFERAKFFFQSAYENYLEIEDSSRVAIGFNNLGMVYNAQGRHDSAIYYLKRALLIKKKFDNPNLASIAYTYHNLGIAHIKYQDYRQAEINLVMSYGIRSELVDLRNRASTANRLSELYLAWGKHHQARPYLDTAYAYAINHNNRIILMDNLELQAQYLRETGRSNVAFDYLERWAAMRDSVFNQEKLKVQEIQSAYELENKERERQLEEQRATSQQVLAETRLAKIWVISLLGLGVLCLMVFMLIQRNRIKKLNEQLDLLNSDIRHRKHNDYNRILVELEHAGFPEIDTIRNILFASVAIDEVLYDGQKNVVRLDRYLNDLLNDITITFSFDKNGIDFKTNIAPIEIFGTKGLKMAFIITELITNSYKHSSRKFSENVIRLNIYQEDNEVIMKYCDNGNEIEKLENSTGMGWNIINQFAKQLGSSLEYNYENGANTFTLVFKC